MSRLEDYVKKTKEYLSKHEDLTETEIIRYVYLDLGKKFSFNLDFAFGNSKDKVHIYKNSQDPSNLEECMKNDTAICKSIAKIVEHVLNELGIKVSTVQSDDNKSYPHVYNIVTTNDYGRYVIDLQRDLGNIQSQSVTQYFGISSVDDSPLITRLQLEQIDKKLGYIDKENYYSDDYIYLLKSHIDYLTDFSEKVRFVLENIDIYENKSVKYLERKNHHEEIFKRLFSFNEMLKIHRVDFYQETEDGKDYKNCIVVDKKGGVDIYIYSVEDNQYKSITLEEFSRIADSGLLYPKQSSKLNQMLKDFRKNEGR